MKLEFNEPTKLLVMDSLVNYFYVKCHSSVLARQLINANLD